MGTRPLLAAAMLLMPAPVVATSFLSGAGGLQISGATDRLSDSPLEEKDNGCDPPRDDRSSDLCAQWKAADAARASADWAMWSFILAAAGTVGVGATVLFSAQATKAAVASANAAVETLHSGRAWVLSSGWTFGDAPGATVDGKAVAGAMHLSTVLRNFGATPALKCGVTRAFEFVPIDADVTDYSAREADSHVMTAIIPQGEAIQPNMAILPQEDVENWLNQKLKLLYAVRVSYFDVYNVNAQGATPHETKLAFSITIVHKRDAHSGALERTLDVQPIGHSSTVL